MTKSKQRSTTITNSHLLLRTFWIIFLLLTDCTSGVSKRPDIKSLKISENSRYFQTENGDPFFWLGDTGWLLFSKLNREEAEIYLDNRAEKGYNVIQAMILHTVKAVNIYGDSALIDGDVNKPLTTMGSSYLDEHEYDYWDHVDYIIQLAESKGIYLALVPVWGSNVKAGFVTQDMAENYATWLITRYGHKKNIIWLNGGDTRGDEHTHIWEAIGNTLNNNEHHQMITFHPFGRTKSSMWFHNAEWLDFNMFQSGHRRYDQDDSAFGYGQDNWRYVQDDYQLQPIKPTLDGEPSYEGIPQGLHDPDEPYWMADDLRRYAYWSVFAGACGFTYGHNAIMQFHKSGDINPAYGVREYWTEALDAQGAGQMKYLKELMLSKPFFDRVPDQSLITDNQQEKYDFLVATRGADYAFIYSYNGREMNVNLTKLSTDSVNTFWFNPKNGEKTFIDKYPGSETILFDPPGEKIDGNDWVLILEGI